MTVTCTGLGAMSTDWGLRARGRLLGELARTIRHARVNSRLGGNSRQDAKTNHPL